MAATTRSASSVLNGDPRNPVGLILGLLATDAEVTDVSRRRRSVNTIFYAYHNVYKDLCYSNKEVPWTLSTPPIFFITEDGVRVPGSEKDGVFIPVRLLYKETYDRAYSNLVKDTSDVTPDIPETYAGDFRNFLKAEGCASPAVRRFEVNLYLAARWLLPVQELGVPTPEAPQPVPYKLKMGDEEPARPGPTGAKQPAAAKPKQPAAAKPKPKARKKKGTSKTITLGGDRIK